MRGVKIHAMVLAFILIALGGGATLYQIFVLNVPVTEDSTDTVWVLDARLSFQANSDRPVKVQMYVPPKSEHFLTLNESFISPNYGVSVSQQDENRLATWSVRRAEGAQVLYYRQAISQRFGRNTTAEAGQQFRPRPALQGAEKLAAEALLEPIRQHSADVETFITEMVRRLNVPNDDNVKLLLGGDTSVENRAQVIETLLAAAYIPSQQVHTVRLADSQKQSSELWLRSHNGKYWVYFSPVTGKQGLPEDRLIWWVGDEPIATVEGGSKPSVNFSVAKTEVNTIQLAQNNEAARQSAWLTASLYELPLPTQNTYRIMLMIPAGVLLILLLRNLVGLETLGTFTPVLVALAFRETEVVTGIVMFSVIIAIGLSLRSYLEHLRLQLLPRLSVVLTFVIILMALISVVGYKLGIERGLSIALFPMVILTMVIERLSIVWEERGSMHALKTAIATLIAATFAHLLMSDSRLSYFCFTFPGILLVMVGIMLLMGHYRGYRLSELIRFRALARKGQ